MVLSNIMFLVMKTGNVLLMKSLVIVVSSLRVSSMCSLHEKPFLLGSFQSIATSRHSRLPPVLPSPWAPLAWVWRAREEAEPGWGAWAYWAGNGGGGGVACTGS